jgi:hypothetical protein
MIPASPTGTARKPRKPEAAEVRSGIARVLDWRRFVVTTACARPVQESQSGWWRAWKPAAVALILGALAFGGVSFHGRATGKGTDYNVFHMSGRLATERPRQLYEVDAGRDRSYTFLNPPLVAILMWPLSALPLGASALVWFLINVACTLHAALILSRLLAPPGRATSFLLLTLILSLPYAVENIQLGQMHAVILYLMVLALAELRGGRAMASAAWMALATAIKLLPGIFAVYFLVRRQWRALSAFVLVVALLTAVPPAIALGPPMALALLTQFYRLQIAPYVSGESVQHAIYTRTALRKTLHDQDLGALLMRHFAADHAAPGYESLALAGLELGTVRRAMFGCFVAVLAVSLLAAWPRADHRNTEPGGDDPLFAVFVVLSLLLSPRNRVAYWPVLMIPWAVLLARIMDVQRPVRVRRIAAWTLAASAALCAVTAVPVGRALTVGLWAQAALWVGLLVLCQAERGTSTARP